MNRKKKIVALTVLGLAALAAQTNAQPAEQPEDVKRAGNAAMRADTNGDGIVDDEERAAARERRADRRAQEDGPGNRPPPFKDANGDGVISQDELPPRAREHFARIDANGDGVIDATELEAMRKRFAIRRPPVFHDANGDGVITADELPPRAREHAAMIDINGDGVIDNAELEAIQERRAMHRRNADGNPKGMGPGRPPAPGTDTESQ
jgi:hypothetical protein